MKFPINQLLYLGIAGLLGASAWQFYETYKEMKAPRQPRTNEVNNLTRKLIEAGRDRKIVAKGPDYAAKDPWDAFREANLIGKEPPPPEIEKDPVVVETPKEVPQTPLDEICSVMCLVFEGDSSRVLIRYLPTAEVEPPPEVLAALNSRPAGGSPVSFPASGTADLRQPNRPSRPQPNNPAMAAMPSGAANIDGHVQLLTLEGSLWPPYEHIRLARVDEAARFAEFVRSKDSVEQDPEKLYRDELDLGQEILAHLSALRRAAGEEVDSPVGDDSPPDDIHEPILPGSSAWRGGERTTRVGGDYHVGRVDWSDWNRDPNRIVNKEVGTRSYSSGGVKGVQITSVSERIAQYGLQANDVVLALNGQPVGSKAEAVSLGKKLYQRGVRTFHATVLSRGRQEVRTYVFPEN